VEGTPFGRYRLIELLGRGGMGEVWRAFDTETQRVVAVKVLPANLANDKTFEQRFRREALAAAGLTDPHVVPIHHFGEIEGRFYVDMRLIEGRDLQAIIAEGVLEPERAVKIIEQVASALNAAHRIGMVHRDVKPSNILIAENDFAYLIDFGIAKAVGETRMTSAGNVIGTWAYMAPERVTSGQIDPRVDTYALACVLHECLTGQPPFPGDSLEQQIGGHLALPPPRPSALRDGLPTQLDSVIATGMAKNPEERYSNVTEMAAAARTAITQPSTLPGPVRPAEPVQSETQPTSPFSPPQSYYQPAPSGGVSPTERTQYGPAGGHRMPPGPPVGPGGSRDQSNRKRLGLIMAGVGTVIVVIGVVLAISLANNDGGNGANGGSGTPRPTSAEAGAPSVQITCGGKPMLNASGSTAQANAMARFIKAFEQTCPGQSLSYTANGSGAGIRDFISGQTDFAGSDSPLSGDEYAAAQQRCGSAAWNLPVVFGPIAVTFNVNGVSSLNLDGPTLAKIFNGAIKMWNDPAVQALNSGFTLPREAIYVIYRSDESGTTDNFQKYLDAASAGAWGKGAGKAFKGGVGEGAKGNAGTAAAIKATEGSITYNEWSFAVGQQLNMAKLVTSAGPDPVAISADSVGKTIAGATISGQGNDLVLDTMSFYRPSRPGSYPIVLATYEIVCSKYPDAQVGTAVRAFLQSTIGAGQNGLVDNGYIPIPDAFKPRLLTAVNAIA
jgi:phosphate transport system substrate-binding protein